jgi:O-antigen/teichoic acid export membrane protein
MFVLVSALHGPILDLLAGGSVPSGAAAALILCAAAYTINSALFWNVPVMFAAGRSAEVARITVIASAVMVAALFGLIPALGAAGAGLAYLIDRVLNNVVCTIRSLQLLRDPQPTAASGAVSPRAAS